MLLNIFSRVINLLLAHLARNSTPLSLFRTHRWALCLKWRRRLRGQLPLKSQVIFYRRISQLSRFVQCTIGRRTCSTYKSNASVQFQIKIWKSSRFRSRSPKYQERSKRTAKECTKIYNARAQPLFCLLPFSLPSWFAWSLHSPSTYIRPLRLGNKI